MLAAYSRPRGAAASISLQLYYLQVGLCRLIPSLNPAAYPEGMGMDGACTELKLNLARSLQAGEELQSSTQNNSENEGSTAQQCRLISAESSQKQHAQERSRRRTK